MHLYRTAIDSVRYRVYTYSVWLVYRRNFSRARNSVRIGHPFTRCMRAGRFLYMPEMLPQRGAASGGERRLHGAARSMAAQQAACGRARAPPSGRSRARSIARGASPRADRRSCAPRCARACAGEAAARRGTVAASVVGCVLCMCGAARHPCVEDMQRGVVAWCGCAFADFLYACYNMYNTSCKEFSHTAIISRTCSHLSGTDSAARGLQAARQLRSKSHSFRRETRRAGRFVMLATVRGHPVTCE